MKRFLLSLSFIICHLSFSSVAAQTQTPAFPGAEGHGRYVTGGRGGTVIHVTNLKDSGTGSFRSAVSGSAKKIIVFDVGGVIALTKDLTIGDNTTILGQTAPAPGITLRYYTVQPGNNNIIRFIRCRRGQEKNVNDGADAIWQRQKTGILLDHCSFSWSIDEVASFYDNNNFTMQWCTIGESLNNAGHGKGAHGYGGIWGGKLASFHHNLILHVNNRSPRFNGARYNWSGYTGNKLYSQYQWKNALQAENVDFRNCVIYNTNGCYGGPGGGQINMVGNYYKSGPASTIDRLTTVSLAGSGNAGDDQTFWDMTSRYYLDGNVIDGKDAGWEKMRYDGGIPTSGGNYYTHDPKHYFGASLTYTKIGGVDCLPIRLDEEAPVGDITTHSAATAYDKVLTYSGASLHPDEVDQRYFSEARSGTVTYKGSVTKQWGRIDLVSDVNGYTEANFGTGSREAGFDTDKDGMPDAWETANGLDPAKNDAAQYTLDKHQMYTNLEVYANSLVQDIMLNENGDALQDQAVNDYFPAYYTEDATLVAAVNAPESPQGDDGQDVSVTLSADTNTGSNTSSAYDFNDGFTITNKNNKGYATGSNNGIKYSAGVQYTINIPSGISIDKAVFLGYDNYTDADAYLGELNGVSFDATQYVFPKSKETVMHTIDIVPAASSQLTFTPQVKQLVLSITLTGKKGGTTAIDENPAASPARTFYYNMQGQRISTGYRGIVVSNGRKHIVR